jgi:hypothetical protein
LSRTELEQIRNKLDSISEQVGQHGLSVTEYPHKSICDGNVFLASHVFESISDSGTASMQVNPHTEDKGIFRFNVSSDGETTIRLFEDPTYSGTGTGVASRNMNRNYSDTTGWEIHHTPTVSSVGTELQSTKGVGGQKLRASGGVTEGSYWRLDTNKRYLITVYNTSGSTVDISIMIEFLNGT